MITLEIRVNRERLKEFPLTVDDYIDLEEGKLRPVREMMTRFVVDPVSDQYMDIDKARRLIGKMPMGDEFIAYMGAFREKLSDAAVPPGNAGA